MKNLNAIIAYHLIEKAKELLNEPAVAGSVKRLVGPVNEKTMSEKAKCELCGEPMPPGEQMFKFHGYSGPCPKPPLHPDPRPSTDLHQLRDLLRRGMKRLEAWQKKYGEQQPEWLPPTGDVEWMEEVNAALGSNVQSEPRPGDALTPQSQRKETK